MKKLAIAIVGLVALITLNWSDANADEADRFRQRAAELGWTSSEDITGACHAHLGGFSSHVQEALKQPFKFARDFRAYTVPNEEIRVLLAEIVLSTDYVPAQYIPLFQISDPNERARLFEVGLKHDNDRTLYYSISFALNTEESVNLAALSVERGLIDQAVYVPFVSHFLRTVRDEEVRQDVTLLDRGLKARIEALVEEQN